MRILATSSLSWPYQLGDLTGLFFFDVPFVCVGVDPLRVCLSWPLTVVDDVFLGADPLVSGECPFDTVWSPPSVARIVFLPVRRLFARGLLLLRLRSTPPVSGLGCSPPSRSSSDELRFLRLPRRSGLVMRGCWFWLGWMVLGGVVWRSAIGRGGCGVKESEEVGCSGVFGLAGRSGLSWECCWWFCWASSRWRQSRPVWRQSALPRQLPESAGGAGYLVAAPACLIGLPPL